MKKLSKQDFIFVLFLIVVLVFLIVSPMILLPRIYGDNNIWNKNLPQETTFLELWEIDTFEGGNANRGGFLEKTAYKFQEMNKNVYIFVRNLNLEQAKSMLANGNKPDMVSYGIGAGELFNVYCKELKIKTPVREDILISGKQNGQVLAMPWCMGGYLLASMNDKNLVDLGSNSLSKGYSSLIGFGQDCNITRKAIKNLSSLNVYQKDLNQYQAYQDFLLGKNFEILLGTQRDYFRLQNKIELGVIEKCNYRYLSGYNDLIQYISVLNSNEGIMSCAMNFIKYLTSTTIQKTLTKIGMFSVTSMKIYENDYEEFENAIQKKINTINLFTNSAELLKMQCREVKSA